METKAWWLSKTIILNLVVLIASILSAAQIIDLGADAQESIGMAVFNALSIWLRFKTNAPVTVTRAE